MARKFSIPVVIVGFVLLSCGKDGVPGGGDASAQQCNPNSCQVKVTVAGTCSNPGDITVEPDLLPVPKEHHHLKIHWEIVTAGFKFVPEPGAITFTTPPLPPPNEFHSANTTANGRRYNLTDENTATVPTSHKYEVHLKRDNGTLCAVKDPVIRNGS